MQRDTAPINTQVPPSRSGAGSTPRASTQEEAEAEWKRSGSTADTAEAGVEASDSNQGLPAVQVVGPTSPAANHNTINDAEIDSLEEALADCWTLCKRLAKMSSGNRQRMFNFSNAADTQDKAWKSCWTLCQALYDGRDKDPASQVKDILNLCRDFCTALFEARDRRDAVKDSILRVSFELNNHLFNTRNPELPDAFTERTLDFYVTLCHRLIKDRSALPDDTDHLLSACWNLAECFFTFRDRQLDKRQVDEETLSSTVQACWDLSDMFRERWSLLRPERGTPRPPQQQRNFQTTSYQQQVPSYTSANSYQATNSYTQAMYSSQPHSRPDSSLSVDRASRLLGPQDLYGRSLPPETPTTIMDERDDRYSPNEPPPPNLLVFGGEANSRNSSRWPSSASNTSGYSDTSGSQHTAGSARTAKGSVKAMSVASGRGSAVQGGGQASPKSVASSRNGGNGQDPTASHITAIKALVLRAALNKGFQRTNITPIALQTFVRGLSATTMFGGEPWQRQLFEQYRRLILADPFMQDTLPTNRRFSALEISYAVRWISKNDHYGWLQSLFDTVFGFTPDAAEVNNRGSGLLV
jgi:hypothetical protein